MTRQVDLKDRSFQSSDKGNILVSPRKFGVEIEVLASRLETIEALEKEVAKCYGFHYDGSIEGGGLHPIEVVTPILGGVAGEKAIKTLLHKMTKLGFETNYSCGVHVHFDAPDFLNTKLSKTLINDRNDIDNMNGIAVSPKLYHTLSKDYSDEEIYKLFIKNKDLVRSRDRVMEIRLKDKLIKIHYYFEFVCFVSEDRRVVPKNCVWISLQDPMNKLKKVMYLYTAYNDMFDSMLPDDRRQNNRYCRKIAGRVAPFEIWNAQKIADLEKMWFRSNDNYTIKVKKGDKYDESRYYGVNFHALFAKFKTIEIRWLEATLNETSILYWIAFHHHIIDTIAEGKISLNDLAQGYNLYRLKDKTDFFFSMFKFDKKIENYIRHRIEFFND